MVVATRIVRFFSELIGIASPSQLGTGTASSTTFLRGDSTWALPPGAGGGGGGTIGQPVGGGSANQVLYTDGSSNLSQSSGFVFNGTNATISGTMTASNVSGTNTGDKPPGGSTGAIQYSAGSGAFGGFGLWDGSTMAVSGAVAVMTTTTCPNFFTTGSIGGYNVTRRSDSVLSWTISDTSDGLRFWNQVLSTDAVVITSSDNVMYLSTGMVTPYVVCRAPTTPSGNLIEIHETASNITAFQVKLSNPFGIHAVEMLGGNSGEWLRIYPNLSATDGVGRIDLGGVANYFQATNNYFNHAAEFLETLQVDEDVVIAGDTSIGGTLSVTGTLSFTGALVVNDTITADAFLTQGDNSGYYLNRRDTLAFTHLIKSDAGEFSLHSFAYGSAIFSLGTDFKAHFVNDIDTPGTMIAQVFKTIGAGAAYTVTRRDTSAVAWTLYSSSGDFSIYNNILVQDAFAISATDQSAVFANDVTALGDIFATSFTGAGSGITGVVHTTGNESIAGIKTFTGSVICSGTSIDTTFEIKGAATTATTGTADIILSNTAVTSGGIRLAAIQATTGFTDVNVGRLLFHVKKAATDSNVTLVGWFDEDGLLAVPTGVSAGDLLCSGNTTSQQYFVKGINANYTVCNRADDSNVWQILSQTGEFQIWNYTTTSYAFLINDSTHDAFFSNDLTVNGGLNVSGKLIVSGNTSDSSINVGTIEVQGYAQDNCWIAQNAYFDGSGWKYRLTGDASQIYFLSGNIIFQQAASGTGGTTLTWREVGGFSHDGFNINSASPTTSGVAPFQLTNTTTSAVAFYMKLSNPFGVHSVELTGGNTGEWIRIYPNLSATDGVGRVDIGGDTLYLQSTNIYVAHALTAVGNVQASAFFTSGSSAGFCLTRRSDGVLAWQFYDLGESPTGYIRLYNYHLNGDAFYIDSVDSSIHFAGVINGNGSGLTDVAADGASGNIQFCSATGTLQASSDLSYDGVTLDINSDVKIQGWEYGIINSFGSFSIQNDKQISWGSGPAYTTQDSGIGRSEAGVLKITNGTSGGGALVTGTSITASRPTVTTVGAQWYDSTLGKPIWWNGSVWKDAMGNTV